MISIFYIVPLTGRFGEYPDHEKHLGATNPSRFSSRSASTRPDLNVAPL